MASIQTISVRNNETVFYVNEGKICNILGILNEEEIRALQNENVASLEESSITKVTSLLEKMSKYVEE